MLVFLQRMLQNLQPQGRMKRNRLLTRQSNSIIIKSTDIPNLIDELGAKYKADELVTPCNFGVLNLPIGPNVIYPSDFKTVIRIFVAHQEFFL